MRLMKPTAPVVFLLLSLASTLTAAETSRYVVGMKRGVVSYRAGNLVHDVDSAPRTRDIQNFTVVNGFAAPLPPEEAASMRLQPGVDYVEPVSIRRAFS